MKKLFWFCLLLLALFEAANVYFIMPMPGSQQANTLALAFGLYQWRWVIRVLLLCGIAAGLLRSKWQKKWMPATALILMCGLAYFINFRMAADAMFAQLPSPKMATVSSNTIDSNRLVLGVVVNGEAKAYPIQVLGYHHFVADTVGGKHILATYCTVCRTGRIYEPLVKGKLQKFRLVGMDHYNAMLEDEATKSWWQQATGVAVAGKLKGYQLPEVYSQQTKLSTWLQLHPTSKVLQMDPGFAARYDTAMKYETGTSRKTLTGTNDSASWQAKSWVVGVKSNSGSAAFDWRTLTRQRMLTGKAGNTQVLLVLSTDNQSFFAYEKPKGMIVLKGDTIHANGKHYRMDGRGLDTTGTLVPLPAYQEFWHSWSQFQPASQKQ